MSVCAALKGHLASLSLAYTDIKKYEIWRLNFTIIIPRLGLPPRPSELDIRGDATLVDIFQWTLSISLTSLYQRITFFITEKIMNIFFEACSRSAQSPNQTEEGEMLPLMGSALRVGTSMHCKWRLMLIAVQKISYFLGSWRSACPKQLRKTSHLTWSLTDSICIYIPNTTWGHQPSFKLVGAQPPSYSTTPYSWRFQTYIHVVYG